MVNAIAIVILIGLTAVLGYIGNYIFRKTRVPDVLWLLLFGIVVSYFNLISSSELLPFALLLATIAVAIEGMDMGLHTNIYKMKPVLGRTLLLSVLSVLFSIAAVTVLASALLKFSLLHSLILGAILGGISNNTVSAIVAKTKMRLDVKMYLSFESAIADSLAVVITVVLLSVTALSFAIVPALATYIAIAVVAGAAAGIVWLIVLDRIKGRSFDYIVTVGVAMLVFAVVDIFTSLGAIAIICFGVIMGNGKRLRRAMRLLRAEKEEYSISPFLKKFVKEIAFFLRAFFFVLLGMLASTFVTNPSLVLYGIVIAAAIIIVRIPAAEIAMVKKQLNKLEMSMVRYMLPRDISAVVLAYLAVVKGVPVAQKFLGIVFFVVIITLIFTSAATIILTRPKPLSEEKKYKEISSRYSYKGWEG